MKRNGHKSSTKTSKQLKIFTFPWQKKLLNKWYFFTRLFKIQPVQHLLPLKDNKIMIILLWCWVICLIFITVTTSFNKSDIAFDKVRKDYKHDANHTRIDRGIWRIIQRAGEILSIIKRTRWSNHCIIIRCWDPIYVEMNCWNVNSWKELFLITVTTLPLSLVEK